MTPAGERSTRDADGRVVILRDERWQHIVSGHPELAGMKDTLLRCVSSPTRHRPGPTLSETWYYLDLGRAPRARWLKVVVRYEQHEGWIVTAFLRRTMP